MNLANVRGILTCLLLTLASYANAQIERYVEGVHYTLLPEAATVAADGQKSVLEVFWYGCNHCYAFDPLLNAWVAGKADTIAFARSPMIWDANTKQHARLFFATQTLGLHEQMHARIFDEIHQKRNFLLDETGMAALFAEFGVERDTLAKTLGSFALDAELRRTETQQRAQAVPSVPALIVNGRYLINTTRNVPSHQAMLDVADFLLNKDS